MSWGVGVGGGGHLQDASGVAGRFRLTAGTCSDGPGPPCHLLAHVHGLRRVVRQLPSWGAGLHLSHPARAPGDPLTCLKHRDYELMWLPGEILLHRVMARACSVGFLWQLLQAWGAGVICTIQQARLKICTPSSSVESVNRVTGTNNPTNMMVECKTPPMRLVKLLER